MASRAYNCVKCNVKTSEFVSFTDVPEMKNLWISILSGGDAEEEKRIRTAVTKEGSGRTYLCRKHFDPSSYYFDGSKIHLKSGALPIDLSMHASTSSSLSQPMGRHSMKKAEAAKINYQEFAKPLPQMETLLPSLQPDVGHSKRMHDEDINLQHKARYCLVDIDCLDELLTTCPYPCGGYCMLRRRIEGSVLLVQRECEKCRLTRNWESSPVVRTKSSGSKEKLHRVTLDLVHSSLTASYGYGGVAPFMNTLDCLFLKKRSYHYIKNVYLVPAVDKVYNMQQMKVVAHAKSILEKGEKLKLAGDAQYDSRGYSAVWGRYVILLNPSGLVLTYSNNSKKIEETSSQRLECIGLRKCLAHVEELLEGHTDPIGRLTTDRASEVIALMRREYSSIDHRFDPWHFARNILLKLLKQASTKAKRTLSPWVPLINAHIWWVFTSENRPGEAREKLLSMLKHVTGVHSWKEDKSFVHVHGCKTHPSGFVSRVPPLDGKAYAALKDILYGQEKTKKKRPQPSVLDLVASVSPDLGTSMVEGFNHIAVIHAPKDQYFPEQGHELRTRIAIIRHNHGQFETLEGKRESTTTRKYFDKTWKKDVEKPIRPKATDEWRQRILEEMINIRTNMESADQWKKRKTSASDDDDGDTEEEDEEVEKTIKLPRDAMLQRARYNQVLRIELGEDSEDEESDGSLEL